MTVEEILSVIGVLFLQKVLYHLLSVELAFRGIALKVKPVTRKYGLLGRHLQHTGEKRHRGREFLSNQ